MKKKLLVLIAMALLTGCTSVGTLGMVTKSSADPAAILKTPHTYKELGQVESQACRFFFLAILPWGDATFSTAADDALAKVGGDALINVTVSNSLYGFIPIYNVFTYTCTDVKGIAIKFDKTAKP